MDINDRILSGLQKRTIRYYVPPPSKIHMDIGFSAGELSITQMETGGLRMTIPAGAKVSFARGPCRVYPGVLVPNYGTNQ